MLISVEAELWALWYEFQLAVSLNLDNIEIKVDATTIIYFMKPELTFNTLLLFLIDECKMLFRSLTINTLKHIS